LFHSVLKSRCLSHGPYCTICSCTIRRSPAHVPHRDMHSAFCFLNSRDYLPVGSARMGERTVHESGRRESMACTWFVKSSIRVTSAFSRSSTFIHRLSRPASLANHARLCVFDRNSRHNHFSRPKRFQSAASNHYLNLRSHFNRDDFYCFVSLRQICVSFSVSNASVEFALEWAYPSS
jgi:hypothetical protein